MIPWDDFIYFILLLSSIIIGYNLKDLPIAPSLRQPLYTCIGILFVALVSGWYILHPIILIAGNLLIIRLTQKPATPSLFFSFGYLAFFRLTDYIGIPLAPAHTNAAMLMIVLRVVGVSNEIEDMIATENKGNQSSAADPISLPSFLSIIHYSFCYIGVLTGPYFRYRTYNDMISGLYSADIVTLPFLIDRVQNVPYYIVMVTISTFLYPLSYARSEDIYNQSVLYRLWYCFPIVLNYRLRMYAAFLLSEGSCIAAGLGGYPTEANSKPGQGPTDYPPAVKHKAISQTTSASQNGAAIPGNNKDDKSSIPVNYDFETVHNVDVWNTEFCSTMREEIKSWNMTVQYWLAVYVYHRVPRTQPRLVRMGATLFVSAMWHGVYSGYYLFFLSAPLMLLTEEVLGAACQPSEGIQREAFNWASWIFKQVIFSYLGVAFLLLRIEDTLHYWWSIYFIGHFLILGVYVVGSVYKYRSGVVEVGRTQPSRSKID